MRGLAPLFIAISLISENTIRSLVGEKIEGTDYYILTVDIKSGNNIVVELESMGPISITDCVDISRQIEHNLDREEEDFSLQVTSPGLDKPLKDFRQYIKNIGRTLNLKLKDDKELEAELIQADQEKITIKTSRKERIPGKKRKELIVEEHVLKYSDIKQAKIKIVFK